MTKENLPDSHTNLGASATNGQEPMLTEDKQLIEAKEQLHSQFRERLYEAVALKNHLLSEKYVSGLSGLMELADKLNTLQCKLAETATSPIEDKSSFVPSLQDLNELDECIMKLTQLANTAAEMPPARKLLSVLKPSPSFVLWALAVIGLAGAIAGFVTAANGSLTVFEGDSLLAASLGLLGGVAYSFFNMIDIVSSVAFDRSKNVARLLLGVLFGWVFYFAFAQSAFANLTKLQSGAATINIVILLPFLAGYSTALVVAILEKALQAVIFALGLDQRSTSAPRTDKSQANTDRKTN